MTHFLSSVNCLPYKSGNGLTEVFLLEDRYKWKQTQEACVCCNGTVFEPMSVQDGVNALAFAAAERPDEESVYVGVSDREVEGT